MSNDILDTTLEARPGRRAVLRGSLLGGAGLAAAALIGCGGGDEEETKEPSPEASDASGINFPNGKGELVKDSNLPYPYNFPEPSKQPKAGGTMVVAASWDVQNIDPAVSAAGGTVTVPNMVYNRLLGIVRGPKAEVYNQPVLEPELAKSWERSPDGMTLTFKIDPRAKWQNLPPLNGRQFVAADAAYTMNRYAKEGVHQQYYANVSSIAAVDDATLKVTMKRPVADFLNPLGANKQTMFPRELVDSGEITKKAVGTGPMILKELASGQRVTFDANRDYWQRNVLIDAFEFRVMVDAAARTAAFRAGQVDYAYQLVATLSDVKALMGTNPNIQVNLLPVIAGTAFAMNLANPKFRDERVRQAVSLAIDRNALTQIVFEGLAKVAGTIPWTFIFDKEPTAESGNLGPWTRHDPKEAKRLLDAAGVSTLTMNNIYYAYGTSQERQTEVLVGQFRDVGITMTGGKADYNEFNSQWIGRKLPEVSTVGWATSGFDPDNWFYGHVHSQSTGNRWNINDPQIDQWAEQQQVTLEASARKEIWRKIWDRELQMAYRPPMVGGFTFEIYQPWLRGIRWTGAGAGDNSSYYNWGSVIAGGWLDK